LESGVDLSAGGFKFGAPSDKSHVHVVSTPGPTT
jgi:hypothetical protein